MSCLGQDQYFYNLSLCQMNMLETELPTAVWASGLEIIFTLKQNVVKPQLEARQLRFSKSRFLLLISTLARVSQSNLRNSPNLL